MLPILACMFIAGTVQAQSTSRLHEVLKKGVLRVGTTGDWNPMTMRNPATNQYQGFDIDMMTELAKDMGVRIEFVPTQWKTLINGIVADKYDVSTSASITTKRIRTVGFTRSYYQVGTVPMTLKSNLSRFSDWEDINQAGVSVAVTLGTSFEQQARQFFPKANIRLVEAPARDFQEVLTRRALISITSNLEASKLIKTHPQLAIIPVQHPRSPADLAMIVSQNDMVWLNFLNHWITIKLNQGFFEGLQRKWMPSQ